MRRTLCSVLIACSLVVLAAPAFAAAPRWQRKLDRLTRPNAVSVHASRGNEVLFSRRAHTRRIPASNEKLLLSMALLDNLGAGKRFHTRALVAAKTTPLVDAGDPDIDEGVVRGDLWIAGSGDPAVVAHGKKMKKWLRVAPTRLGMLARAIKKAGVRRIIGGIAGGRAPFKHDWWAPGWESDFPREEVALPSALTVDLNVRKGQHVAEPEYWAALALTHKLESIGVKVRKGPRSGYAPKNLAEVGRVSSAPLGALLTHMNRVSSNFFAEVLGKALAVDAGRIPGTIAKGAAVLRRWIERRGVTAETNDGSGLSYSNRSSALGIVRLLRHAERRPWMPRLKYSLPHAGVGTLEGRLDGVKLRAKTGTLQNVSALSGWLWLTRSDEWGRFSIMIQGIPAWEAKAIEDDVVRILAAHF